MDPLVTALAEAGRFGQACRMSEPPVEDLHRPKVWSGVAAGYETSVMPIMQPFAVTTLDLLGLTSATTALVRLLDVVAGTGVVAAEAARRGADVLATDFAPGMVAAMRRRFAAEGLHVRAVVMDGQTLDLVDASFDLATSTFGLIFFLDPVAGLRELRRVLRPGGRVGIAAWELAGVGLPQLIGEALAQVIPDLPPPPAPSWAPLGQPEGLEQALLAAGFTTPSRTGSSTTLNCRTPWRSSTDSRIGRRLCGRFLLGCGPSRSTPPRTRSRAWSANTQLGTGSHKPH
jgi:SAM-dependent methyltransferase